MSDEETKPSNEIFETKKEKIIKVKVIAQDGNEITLQSENDNATQKTQRNLLLKTGRPIEFTEVSL